MPDVFIPYAGSLGVGRALMSAGPLISFMGRKDKMAPHLLKVVKWGSHLAVDRLHINDAGHWGYFWKTFFSNERRELIDVLGSWAGEDRVELWEHLVAPPWEGTPQGVAAFLFLQGRSIKGVPLFWDGSEWKSHRGNGSIKSACQRQAPIPGKGGGGITAKGIQKRLEALSSVNWPPVVVTIDRAESIGWAFSPGSFVYMDPPYSGATPYQVKSTRAGVVQLALSADEAGAAVLISEREGISELPGWATEDMTQYGFGKKEFVTWNGAEAQ